MVTTVILFPIGWVIVTSNPTTTPSPSHNQIPTCSFIVTHTCLRFPHPIFVACVCRSCSTLNTTQAEVKGVTIAQFPTTTLSLGVGRIRQR